MKIINKRFFIYFAVFTVGFFWGISFLATSLLLKAGAEPIQIQTGRWLIAAACYAALVISGKVKISLRRPGVVYLILAGVFQPCCYMIFENYGIKLSNASIGAIFIATIPCFALILNTIIYKHHTSRMGVISILVAFTGVTICTVFSPGFTTGGDVKGYLCLLGAVLSGALYGIVSSRAGEHYDAVEITTIMSIIGFLFFNVMNMTMGYGLGTYSLLFSGPEIICGVIFLGLGCSALGFLLLNKVVIMMDDPALGTNMTSSITTVVGALAGIIIAGDPAGIYTIVGLTLTVVGVFLTTRSTDKLG